MDTSMVMMHTNDYVQARASMKNNRYKADYAAVGTAFAPAIVIEETNFSESLVPN